MTNQKILPCPICGGADSLNVYTYDSGWRYVECDKGWNTREACWYRGPGEGSVKQAIRSHNERTRSALSSSPVTFRDQVAADEAKRADLAGLEAQELANSPEQQHGK